jgi:predicted RNA-binding Zn ribbon-like protein
MAGAGLPGMEPAGGGLAEVEMAGAGLPGMEPAGGGLAEEGLPGVGLPGVGLAGAGLRTAGLATAGRDPGGRAPAPGSLRLIQALVNTSAVEFDRELLGSTAAASEWLSTAGLLPPTVQLAEPELRALVELREAIRDVLAAHTAGQPDPEAARRLTMALTCSRLTVTVDHAGDVRLTSADHDPFTRVVGAIAAVIAEAAVTGTWFRLKSCPGHLCGWAFYDRSSVGRSRWCSMQLCGSRNKMRAYRDRSRPT